MPLLRQLNRPGILTLQTANGATAYALLVGLSDQTATLRLSGRLHTVRLVELAQLWRGDFATYWQVPPGYTAGLHTRHQMPAGNAGTPSERRPVWMAASASTAAQAATLLGELPAELRSQIPKITITGSVYSDSPAQRLLLVNNLVLAQGAQVASDLTLEEIQRRSSVFNFKGTRFRVMH